MSEIILGHGDYQYKLITDWAKVDRDKTPLMNCHEMQMDSKGRLIMMGDHPKNNIVIFDKSGKVLDAWGTSFPGGHGLTINNEGGEDFLYLTDSGWFVNEKGLNQQNGSVSKTTMDGKTIFNIEHPHKIGEYKEDELFCPSETAIGPNGDIYVADGYGQDYILQYNSKGEFIRKWGGKGNPDPNYRLISVHGIAIDNRDASNPLLMVTSRMENAFKFYTLDGQYVKTIQLPNMFVCRPVIDDQNVYAGVCWSLPEGGGEFNPMAETGFMTILEGDKVVSNPGGTAPTYVDGQLQPSFQLPSKPIIHGHDVCVDEDKNLYLCQWNARGVAPYKLERI